MGIVLTRGRKGHTFEGQHS